MNLTGGIVLYVVLWVLVLFLMLPFSGRSQAEAGEVVPGTPAGAPADARLGRKALWATVIAAVLWAGAAWLILGGGISRDDVMSWDRFLRG